MGKEMISFKDFVRFLFEGGNITGPNGETCSPISTKNRHKVAGDIIGSLSELHKSFHASTGKHLFGKDEKALKTGSAFSGSSAHLVNPNITDEELHKHKPTMGDVDAQVPKEHLKDLHAHLTPGRKVGKYTVVGTKKHGVEVSAIMKHDETGEHHQVDFEGVDYHKEEPTKFEQFAHSSHWEDTKNGVKGAAHKQLLNAAGSEGHKFSITHGLNKRDGTGDAVKDPTEISKRLFGNHADHSKIHSFDGVAQSIRDNVHPSKHADIIKKFSERGTPEAVHRLKHILGHNLQESANTHSVAVSPMSGFSPCSHIGHQDLVDAAKSTGVKNEDIHIGISKKSDFLSPEERTDIFKKQSPKGVNVHAVSGAGETIRAAHDSIQEGKRRVLHLVGGNDRLAQLHGLKKSLEEGKVKEMEGRKFDEIHVHTPEAPRRTTSNGNSTSGTNMRAAIASGDKATVKEHLGGAYSPELHKRLEDGIKQGKIKLKR